jgi:hypothetical protein
MNEEAPLLETVLYRLVDFAQDGKALPPSAFAQKYGGAFLLHHGPLDRLRQRSPDGSTLGVEGHSTASDVPFNPRQDFLVFPLKRRADSQEEVIWIGSSQTNDVVIPDASVSAIHAFVKPGQHGTFFLQDMRSRNGTLVDGQKVPPHGLGEAVELTTGAEVVLGSVRLNFLPAAEFCSLVGHLVR